MCWILQLQAQQELEGLNRIEASVHEITHEDVSGVWDLTTPVEQFEQVVELAVNVSANGHGSSNGLRVAFLNENLLDLLTENSEFTLR